jgi:GT2 family glycosyltransferase
MSRGAFREHSFTELNLQDIVPILYPSPTAALYRRQMIDDVGFFDDEFFAYAEDTDLGLRVRWAGWGAVAATKALVHHRYSATGGVLSPMKVFLVERNHYWVAVKNFPLTWLIALPFWGVIRFLVQLKCVFAGRGTGEVFLSESRPFGLVKSTVRAQFAALAKVPEMLRKRRAIMKSRRLSDAQMSDLLNTFRLSFSELFDLTKR